MQNSRLFVATWFLFSLAVMARAHADDPSMQLMLDTGGHMAPIVDLAVTPDGKQIVSASNDKTVRIWDVDTGKTLRIIRGETGPGSWGAIYAMALSPDGRRLAVGGFLSQADRSIGSAVRLYDFATGKQETLLKGHDNVVLALSFSRDSERLISGSGDKSAIVWDLKNGQQISRLTGHSEPISGVAFSNAGDRVITSSRDGTVRLWSASDGTLIAEMNEHKSEREKEVADIEKKSGQSSPQQLVNVAIESLAVSPVDDIIASGSSDGRILLWNGRTGKFLRQLANPGGMVGMSEISALQFSPDGRWLLSASNFEGCELYEVATGAEMVKGKLYDTPPTMFDDVRREKCANAVAFSADGMLAAGSYNNQITLLNGRTNSPIKVFQGFGATVQGVGFARDGRSIAWGHTVEKDGKYTRLTRELRLPGDDAPLAGPLAIGETGAVADKEMVAGENYRRRTQEHETWSVGFKSIGKGLINSQYLQISKAGNSEAEIDLDNRGSSPNSPMSFAADGQTLLFGGTPDIHAFDLTGKALGRFIGHSGMLRDIVPSADGRYLLSGAADQTARLWNLNTRELIVSIFDGADGEWVIWTPQGYYASSPNGDRIVGWQINRGAEQTPDHVRASQLRRQFYRPDIVERAIELASASQAIEEAGLTRSGNFRLSDLIERLPPQLSLLSPGAGAETSSGQTNVALEMTESAGDPVADFEVFVNDIKVAATAKRESDQVSFAVPLGQGENRIRMVARSKTGLIGETALTVTQNGEGLLDKRDRLFILAIGADHYPDLPKRCGADGRSSCDLAFAGADARSFAETVEAQMGPQHRMVVTRVLVNGAGEGLEPTRDNIENALDLLLQAQDNDTIAVFVAGHGFDDARTGYQFLPSDARAGVGGHFASSSVLKWATLDSALQTARGRRLLFVDTCRSGNAFNARLMKDASDGAIVAFSATNTQQDALELPSLGHGVFTGALIAGLNGAADLAQENEVRVFDLGTFLEREVRKLTKGRQTPDFYKKPGAENFVLVRTQ